MNVHALGVRPKAVGRVGLQTQRLAFVVLMAMVPLLPHLSSDGFSFPAVANFWVTLPFAVLFLLPLIDLRTRATILHLDLLALLSILVALGCERPGRLGGHRNQEPEPERRGERDAQRPSGRCPLRALVLPADHVALPSGARANRPKGDCSGAGPGHLRVTGACVPASRSGWSGRMPPCRLKRQGYGQCDEGPRPR